MLCRAAESSNCHERDHAEHLPGLQVNYKNVMKQYNLGPNGGILTSLNLFATRFDQVCLNLSNDCGEKACHTAQHPTVCMRGMESS